MRGGLLLLWVLGCGQPAAEAPMRAPEVMLAAGPGTIAGHVRWTGPVPRGRSGPLVRLGPRRGLPGARVFLEEAPARRVVTGADGRFTLSNVTPGSYEVVAVHPGWSGSGPVALRQRATLTERGRVQIEFRFRNRESSAEY